MVLFDSTARVKLGDDIDVVKFFRCDHASEKGHSLLLYIMLLQPASITGFLLGVIYLML